MEGETKREVISTTVDKFQWGRCAIGLHKRSIIDRFEVVNSHIDYGTDFFNCEIPDCTHIISNPPYSLKSEVFERLFEIKKPLAMLVGVVGLFESQKRFEMFRDNEFEVMYLNRRVSYFKDYLDEKPALNPPFSSVYLCSQMLPDRIIFEEISKK